MRFAPLRRLRSREPVRPGLPRLVRDTCRVRALLASCFSRDLHGLVSCRARPWGSALRSIFLRGEGGRLSTPSSPLAVGSNASRLPPRRSPGFRGLLPPEVRRRVAERSRRAARGSLGLSPLQGFPPDHDGPRLPACLLSRAWPEPAPQSLDHSRAGSSPERPPPLLRFLHLIPAPVSSWLRRPGLMNSPRRQVISRFLSTPMRAVTQPLPQARRIGYRCRSRFVRPALDS